MAPDSVYRSTHWSSAARLLTLPVLTPPQSTTVVPSPPPSSLPCQRVHSFPNSLPHVAQHRAVRNPSGETCTRRVSSCVLSRWFRQYLDSYLAGCLGPRSTASTATAHLHVSSHTQGPPHRNLTFTTHRYRAALLSRYHCTFYPPQPALALSLDRPQSLQPAVHLRLVPTGSASPASNIHCSRPRFGTTTRVSVFPCQICGPGRAPTASLDKSLPPAAE